MQSISGIRWLTFYQEVRQSIELHCDEKVCQSLTREECIEYGKRILDAAVQDSNTGVLNFRGKIRYHNMEERIKMIKENRKTEKESCWQRCC